MRSALVLVVLRLVLAQLVASSRRGLRLAGWWAQRCASRVRCWTTGRHRLGSQAWTVISSVPLPGWRPRHVYVCRFCGVVAVKRNEPRGTKERVREALRRGGHHA